MLVQSTNKKEDSIRNFYHEQLSNPNKAQEIANWMVTNNCSTDCNDKLQSYLDKRYSIGFIVTGINLLLVILPILSLIIIILVMATIRPQEESDDVAYVPSNFEHSIIEARRYLTHELLSEKM